MCRHCRRLDEAEINRSRLESIEDCATVRDLKCHRVGRPVSEKRFEPWRKEVLGDRVARCDAQETALLGFQRRDARREIVGPAQEVDRPVCDELSVGRGPRARRRPFEQTQPELAFERVDPARRGRLCHPVRLRRPGDTAQVDHGTKQVKRGKVRKIKWQWHMFSL